MKKPNVVALIPAKGTSKGLPGKNLMKLAGVPMIAYTINAALKSKYIDRVLVATDDKEIAKVAKEYGAEVPILLPKDLTQDFSSTEGSCRYLLQHILEKEKYKADIFVYLQLTDFFKRTEWIDKTIKTLIDHPNIDSCFIVCKDHKNYWREINGIPVNLAPDRAYVARQKKEPLYREDTGLGCATRAYFLLNFGRRLGFKIALIKEEYTLYDLHDEYDFWLLEKVLKERPEFSGYIKEYGQKIRK